MSRSAVPSKLLALVDSDSDELSELGAKTNTNNKSKPDEMMPAKKARGRPPAANKVTKPPQKSTRRTSEKYAATAAAAIKHVGDEDTADKASKGETKAPKRGRKAKSRNDDDDVEDAGEESLLSETASITKPRGRPKTTVASAKIEDEGTDAPDVVAKLATQPAKRGRRPVNKSTRNVDSEVPETQPPEAMDIDITDDEHFDDLPAPKRTTQRASRAGVNQDVEAGEAQLRRRLGETTRRYENLELKYHNLRDIGIKAAERNFDNLKQESEERANTASELIGNLKADLATQKALVKEGQQNKKKLEEMETRVAELTASLGDARQEIKTLSTKLAASRSAEAAATVKVTGSAVKGGNSTARAIASSDAVQTAQLKEDLYGDLTGLIVRVVKRDSAGQVFDCIQTGRNGTLHFKLEVEKESSGDSYEEAHFTYKPQLDSNRDRNLIDLLPDFLAEEIEFSRPHAAKFYSRVTKSLME